MVQYENVYSQAEKNFRSGIGTTYTQQDVISVWREVAKFILSSLALKRAVDIHGLGRFTIQEVDMPISQAYSLFWHRPLFYLDKTLCHSYNIKCVRYFSSDKINVIGLNLTVIASLAGVTRHTAEDIIGEVVQAFRVLCMQHSDVEMPLPPLGVLRVVNRVVDMRYSRAVVRKLHQELTDPCVLASHVRACDKRPVPAPTLLAPVAVPDRYLRGLHAVNYG